MWRGFVCFTALSALLAVAAGASLRSSVATTAPAFVRDVGQLGDITWQHDGEAIVVKPPTQADLLGNGANGQVYSMGKEGGYVLKVPVDGDPVKQKNIEDEVDTFKREVGLINFIKERMEAAVEDDSTSEDQKVIYRHAMGLVHVPVVEAAEIDIEGRGENLRGVFKEMVDGVELDSITQMLTAPKQTPLNGPLTLHDAAKCSLALKGLLGALAEWGADYTPAEDEPYHLTDWKTSNMMWGKVPASEDCRDKNCLVLIDLMWQPNSRFGEEPGSAVQSHYVQSYRTLTDFGFDRNIKGAAQEEALLNGPARPAADASLKKGGEFDAKKKVDYDPKKEVENKKVVYDEPPKKKVYDAKKK